MAYKTLGKFYYEDKEGYAAEYKRRLQADETVQLDFEIAKNPAFFMECAEAMKMAYEIVKLDRQVAEASASLPGIAREQYSRKCLIDEIVLTNKIEGVHSSRKEIGEALDILEKQSAQKGKKQRFIGLVNKYLKLMSGEKIPLESCMDVRAIYDEVFLQEVLHEEPDHAPDGKIFRKDITQVYNETGDVIHSGVYPEENIIHSMESALTFLHDPSIDPLCRACIFHYLIEYIHPFYDGNGRLGRLILSYCLSEQLTPLVAYRISETIKENVKGYYKAFSTCNDPRNLGDLTPFLLMMLQMIHTALQELYKSLLKKKVDLENYRETAYAFAESADKKVWQMYNLLIQAALFSENGISTETLTRVTEQSYKSVMKYLGKVNKALLICEKKGNTKYYRIDLNGLDRLQLEQKLQDLSKM